MPGPRYGLSSWLDGAAPAAARQRLRGEQTTDVAIVGGGLAGAMNAYVFAHAGIRTVMVEAERVGGQATALASGVIDAGTAGRFADLRERHGLKAARHLWESSRRAGLDLQALVGRLKIRCDLTRIDVAVAALSDADATALERERRALEEAGLNATWITGSRVRAATGLDARGMLKRGDAATADPFRLTQALVGHAERAGAAVFEKSPARRIRPGRRQVDVTFDGATIRAAAVVVATSRPQPDLGALHRHVRAVDTICARLSTLPAPVRRSFGAFGGVVIDSAASAHAWRVTRDGGLLIWQGDHPRVAERQRQAATVQRAGQLMYEMSVLYPDLSGLRPSHAWTSSSFRSQDGLVIAGAHRAFPRHLFAVGMGRDGLQGAYLAARLNLRHYLGAPEKGDELFGFIR